MWHSDSDGVPMSTSYVHTLQNHIVTYNNRIRTYLHREDFLMERAKSLSQFHVFRKLWWKCCETCMFYNIIQSCTIFSCLISVHRVPNTYTHTLTQLKLNSRNERQLTKFLYKCPSLRFYRCRIVRQSFVSVEALLLCMQLCLLIHSYISSYIHGKI